MCSYSTRCDMPLDLPLNQPDNQPYDQPCDLPYAQLFDQKVMGTVVPGYGVASGRSLDSPYPQGTIAMQAPLFRALGLDLTGYFMGTINLSISPYTFNILSSDYCFKQIQWADGFPPETFSFCRCEIQILDQTLPSQTLPSQTLPSQTLSSSAIPAWIYYPHPETKIGHIQTPSLLELIAPPIPSLVYGDRLDLRLSSQQFHLH